INHKEYFAVNLATLQKLAEEKGLTKIGIEELVAAGLTNGKEQVKILGNGELKAKVDVVANAFSKTAEEAIKAVGGTATII
ncbi:MAG: mitochondrial large ribosomal subunit protein uL15m, partial [Prevotella sp.]|nr:mitochondrial large ribosomal subunit protein uL15m [Prevotella sp.]